MISRRRNWRNEAPPAGVAERRLTPKRGGNRRSPPSDSEPAHLHVSDLYGFSRLAVAAIEGVIDLVEVVHRQFLRVPSEGSSPGITILVYQRVRACTASVSRWSEYLLARYGATSGKKLSTSEREAVLSVLNGLTGDYLARSGNPLAIPMRLRVDGRPLELKKRALAAALPHATGKLLILVHGLCRCDLQWRRGGHDHGAALARDLGYTPLYLHYNTGLHVSMNGREFSALLEAALKQWPVPVEEVVILAHSMGGLVSRSACYYGREAGHEWVRHLRHMIFLGTPHHGAPLERGGNWLVEVLGRSAYAAPFARLGRVRSAGITDLRYGNLVDEDWQGRDRFEHGVDSRRRVPLPRGVKCYAIAGSTGRSAGDLRERFLGDGLIPLDTALGRHEEPSRNLFFPRSRQWVAYGIHHLDLLGRLEVYEKIREWLAQGRQKK